MRPLYIFDLDGTLANMEHRVKFISGGKKDWTGFFAACHLDEPIMETINTLKALRRGGAEIWIWTGRSDEVKTLTVAWLIKHGCLPRFRFLSAPEMLRMRQAGDHQLDHSLKLGWLADMEPPERARLTAVFEDRDQVVKMWRDFGVTCYQVAPGKF